MARVELADRLVNAVVSLGNLADAVLENRVRFVKTTRGNATEVRVLSKEQVSQREPVAE